jgi:hypothetical protein
VSGQPIPALRSLVAIACLAPVMAIVLLFLSRRRPRARIAISAAVFAIALLSGFPWGAALVFGAGAYLWLRTFPQG